MGAYSNCQSIFIGPGTLCDSIDPGGPIRHAAVGKQRNFDREMGRGVSDPGIWLGLFRKRNLPGPSAYCTPRADGSYPFRKLVCPSALSCRPRVAKLQLKQLQLPCLMFASYWGRKKDESPKEYISK